MYLHPLLSSLSTADRTALIQRSEFRSCRRNDLVIEPDEQTDRMYCITGGLLRVVACGNAGNAGVTTDFIRGGDIFHGPLLSEERYQAASTLIAALPSSVYLVPVAAVRELCAKHPEMALGLVDLTLRRTGLLRRHRGHISSLAAQALVGRVLYELISAIGCTAVRPRQGDPHSRCGNGGAVRFPAPAVQGILGCVTQLTNGCPAAFIELDVEIDRSDPVFV